MIRSRVGLPLAVIMALTLAACGSNVTIPTFGVPGAGGGPTLAPGQTAAAGNQCAPYPTANLLASPQPEMPVDSALLAELPTQVAGQATTEIQAVPFLAFMCMFVGEAAVDQMGTTTSVLGLNISTMSFGSFTATVNGDSVNVTALRTPGQDAGHIMSNFGLFGAFAGISASAAGLSNASLGGKNVQVSTDSTTSDKSYFYAHGDTLFIIDGSNDADAGPVLQALP